MIVLKVFVATTAVIGLLYWIFQLILAIRVVRAVHLVEEMPLEPGIVWPRVSLIMTARNEAGSIEDALKIKLADDYPNLEYILVDDRSDDGTGEIFDRIATNEARVKVVHVAGLPEDWLGKLYALHQGQLQATGEWLLFSDADVVIKPSTIKRAIRFCQSRNLDHLAILPQIYPAGFLLDIVVSVFVRLICLGARAWAIEDAKSDAAAGSGSFNLVRRAAFEKTKGFEWIRLETGDDAALGQMLKQTGARGALASGRDYVGVHWYRSLRAIVLGSERPVWAALANFSLKRALISALVLFMFENAPYFALIPVGMPCLAILGGIAIALGGSVSALFNLRFGRPLWSAFFVPVGIAVMSYVIVRSALLGSIRGGVYWRGTFYPDVLLKQGRRLNF